MMGCAFLQDARQEDRGNFLRDPAFYGAVAGLVIVGLLAARFMNRNDGYGHGYHHSPYLSDERLKTDVEQVATTTEGIRVYKFRYRGDERFFIGVMAQELLSNPVTRHAVSEREGYYAVDYAALGMTLKNPEIMKEAGETALARAM
jgi:hypothetical protein